MRKKTINWLRSLGILYVSGTLLLSVLPFFSPAYAATTTDLTDIDATELLPDTKQAAPFRFRGHVGGEINYAAGIIDDAQHRGRLIPLYFVEYDDWVYVNNTGGIEAGVWLWKTPDHIRKAGVSIQRQIGGPILDGMKKRKDSADGVMNIRWRTSTNFVHLSYHRDIGNVSNGNSAMLVLSRNLIFRQFVFDHDLLLVPRIDMEWQSARLVDYYYGVRPSEATPDRPVYAGRDTINGGIKLTGFLRINRSWVAFVGMHTAVFGSGITDSPIVTRHSTTRGYIGTAWLF